jgi:two-component system, response regulator
MHNTMVEILLVEDNPNDVALTLRAFKRYNLSNGVHVVYDGAEALEFLFGTDAYTGHGFESTPRVILLDLQLPKVDGLEVLQRIKADPRTCAIPVVVLISSREQSDVVESYRLGVDSYIVKPVDFDQFTEAMRHLGLYWVLLNQPPILQSPHGK